MFKIWSNWNKHNNVDKHMEMVLHQRYFYCAKTSKAERNQGLDNLPTKKASSMPGRRNPNDMKDSKIDNDVTGRFVTQKKNIHPTVKPIKLMKYLCRLITPKGGTILDPFMGSGSTGMLQKKRTLIL